MSPDRSRGRNKYGKSMVPHFTVSVNASLLSQRRMVATMLRESATPLSEERVRRVERLHSAAAPQYRVLRRLVPSFLAFGTQGRLAAISKGVSPWASTRVAKSGLEVPSL
jgi:hypothetical protein